MASIAANLYDAIDSLAGIPQGFAGMTFGVSCSVARAVIRIPLAINHLKTSEIRNQITVFLLQFSQNLL